MNLKISGIYGIRNLNHDKWYIGQSLDVYIRRAYHWTHLRSGKHDNKYLCRAFRKYGSAMFEFRVLEEVDKELLDERERFWIAQYRSANPSFGYNLESGGSRGKHLSTETRRKISKANGGARHCCYGKHLSMETKRRISESHKGIRPSEETRRKLSEASKGQSPSEDTRKKLSDAIKRYNTHNQPKRTGDGRYAKQSENWPAPPIL